MEKPKSEYPTREQLAEVLDLNKQYGKEGIRMFLQKQRALQKQRSEREAQKSAEAANGTWLDPGIG